MTNPPYESVKCPECNGEMISRTGKYGTFWGCKKFPTCKGTRDSMGRSKADREEWKRKQAEEKGEELEDVERDTSLPLNLEGDYSQKYTSSFNKKKN